MRGVRYYGWCRHMHIVRTEESFAMARKEIPLFTATDRRGLPSGTQTAWQFKDMLVVVLHDRCERCREVAARLADPPADLRDPELAILPVVPPGAQVPLPQAIEDREGHITRRLREVAGGPGDAALVLIADRFAELFAVLDVHAQPPAELMADVAAWVDAVQRQCGECSRMDQDALA